MLEDAATKKRILIDCGLLQSRHTCEDSNWSAFPYDPKTIDVLVVTHAHIDHVGKIPRLVKEGFTGKILSTEATKAIAGPMLEDSVELMAHEGERCGKGALYDQHDIPRAMALWEGIGYHQPVELPGGYTLEFFNAGHILGAAMARITRADRSIMFTGDLGGGNSPILPKLENPSDLNYLVMESVYGDVVRKDDNRREMLENAIEDAIARGGVLLIPAFSTERTQDLLFEIRLLMIEKRIPSVPVYVDSPLATKITEAYLAHPDYFSDEIRTRVEGGEKIFSFPELRFVESAKESQGLLGNISGPAIILAGSGMSNGGRIIEHERHLLSDPKATLMIVGYQAAGSLGRRLLEGEKNVTIRGDKVSVRCAVVALYGYSAHLDGEGLVDFAHQISQTSPSLQQIFVVMGELAASGTLAQRIRDYLGVRALVPEAGTEVAIEL